MKFDIKNMYLTGEIIDNGKVFDFSDKIYNSRIELLSNIIEEHKDCKVVHLGACDHEKLIAEKIENNSWLHKIISEVSCETVGFDINKNAVKYCNEIGWKNIYLADMTKDIDFIKRKLRGEKWNYMIAGEIIEHLDSPVEFLSAINRNYAKDIEKIIITVPNAFSLTNIKMALKGRECINTDHRYWFTPYTISKVAYNAGMIPETILYADQWLNRFEKLFMGKVWKKSITSETIILIAKLENEPDRK